MPKKEGSNLPSQDVLRQIGGSIRLVGGIDRRIVEIARESTGPILGELFRNALTVDAEAWANIAPLRGTFTGGFNTLASVWDENEAAIKHQGGEIIVPRLSALTLLDIGYETLVGFNAAAGAFKDFVLKGDERTAEQYFQRWASLFYRRNEPVVAIPAKQKSEGFLRIFARERAKAPLAQMEIVMCGLETGTQQSQLLRLGLLKLGIICYARVEGRKEVRKSELLLKKEINSSMSDAERRVVETGRTLMAIEARINTAKTSQESASAELTLGQSIQGISTQGTIDAAVRKSQAVKALASLEMERMEADERFHDALAILDVQESTVAAQLAVYECIRHNAGTLTRSAAFLHQTFVSATEVMYTGLSRASEESQDARIKQVTTAFNRQLTQIPGIISTRVNQLATETSQLPAV